MSRRPGSTALATNGSLASWLPVLCAVVLGAGLLASGCKPHESAEDHTVRKLQEAMKAPPMMEAPPNRTPTEHLADLATGKQPPGERTLGGTGNNVRAGAVSYELTAASELQSVGDDDVKIASAVPFVRVNLSVANSGGEVAALDLSSASLGKGSERSGIAPDAQQLEGTRALKLAINPHGSTDVVLWFEAPAIQPPFTLHLPKPGGGEVELAVP